MVNLFLLRASICGIRTCIDSNNHNKPTSTANTLSLRILDFLLMLALERNNACVVFRLIISLFSGCWSAKAHTRTYIPYTPSMHTSSKNQRITIKTVSREQCLSQRRVSLIVNRWTKHSYINRGTVQTSWSFIIRDLQKYRKSTLKLVYFGQCKKLLSTSLTLLIWWT